MGVNAWFVDSSLYYLFALISFISLISLISSHLSHLPQIKVRWKAEGVVFDVLMVPLLVVIDSGTKGLRGRRCQQEGGASKTK